MSAGPGSAQGSRTGGRPGAATIVTALAREGEGALGIAAEGGLDELDELDEFDELDELDADGAGVACVGSTAGSRCTTAGGAFTAIGAAATGFTGSGALSVRFASAEATAGSVRAGAITSAGSGRAVAALSGLDGLGRALELWCMNTPRAAIRNANTPAAKSGRSRGSAMALVIRFSIGRSVPRAASARAASGMSGSRSDTLRSSRFSARGSEAVSGAGAEDADAIALDGAGEAS